LALGISVAALVVADSFYSEKHGTKMWMPSKFAFRAVTSSGLLTYFVVKEMRRRKAMLEQILASVLFATLVQLGVLFALRETINQLPGLSYSAIVVVVELFFVWQLTVEGIPYLTGRRR